MQYENRQPVEGINVTRVNPLVQFAQLAIGALVLIVIMVFLLQVSGAWLAKRVPFSFELAIMNEFDAGFGDNADDPRMATYLNELAQSVATHMDLPEGMQVLVHYDQDTVFNAFATIGGNLVFYRELLVSMPNENTLAMVMAHEIAHVLHRDPIAALGGGVASMVAMLAFTGNAGTGAAGSVLRGAGAMTSVQFTQSMEVAADTAALQALNARYGHVNGATALFDMFSDARARGRSAKTFETLEKFASTHPLDSERIDAVGELARQKGWQMQGTLTPLPAEFSQWLEGSR